ncbi:hypothetical protein TSUD_255290 [Trifolium subterraneum]|uniref:RNase H type-1 domain-containing protein n=1 Tax=Trifolium subterraneum TaxID=3900 RepID=A0A2Z6NK08_TRISU|nr:hypothetical protein TSUD_255290 [Trifolium subterraneum]
MHVRPLFALVPSSVQGVDRLTWCKQLGKKHGNIIFVTLWMVWCVRNNFIFNNHQESTHTSVAKSHSLVNASAKAFSLPSVVSPLAGHQRSVRWFRPADEFVCLNVDGSLLGSNNTAGYDGLLRNRDGEFIWGFYGVAAIQNILYAEIMAIWYGLKLCWERGFRKVFCCSDYLLSVDVTKEGVTTHHRFANEILCIRKLLANDWEVILTHTLREGNACADVLGKLGVNSDSSMVNIYAPSQDLVIPLHDDASGIEFIRE